MKGKTIKKTKASSKNLKDALIQKALGYDAVEVIEEYSEDDGEVKLIKRKVTTKNVPPDVTALKLLIENFNENSLESMSDEQLEKEKIRLLELLAKSQTKKGE